MKRARAQKLKTTMTEMKVLLLMGERAQKFHHWLKVKVVRRLMVQHNLTMLAFPWERSMEMIDQQEREKLLQIIGKPLKESTMKTF